MCNGRAGVRPDENPAGDYEVLSDGDVDAEFELV